MKGVSTPSHQEVARRLGDYMAKWRTDRGLSLEKAAQRMGGRDLQAWDRWEKGQRTNPTLKTLIELAAVMDVELPALIADIYPSAPVVDVDFTPDTPD